MQEHIASITINDDEKDVISAQTREELLGRINQRLHWLNKMILRFRIYKSIHICIMSSGLFLLGVSFLVGATRPIVLLALGTCGYLLLFYWASNGGNPLHISRYLALLRKWKGKWTDELSRQTCLDAGSSSPS